MTTNLRASRAPATTLTETLDVLPHAFEQLWMYWLPGNYRVDRGSRQRHGIDSTRNLINLEVLDLTDPREKPDADIYRTAAEIDLDKHHGRRQGVRPILNQWVRLADDQMVMENYLHEEPYTLLSCGPVCRFADEADEVMLWPIYPGYACTEIERTHFRKPTVAGHCRWLAKHHTWIDRQDFARPMAKELSLLLGDIQAITGSDLGPKPIPCPDSCGFMAQPEKNGQLYRCTGCERAWSRGQLERLAERNSPKTIDECAEILNVAESTLWRYLRQELITPLKQKRGKALLFFLPDVDSATRDARYKRRVAS